jgi:hypothetical protein
MNFITQSYVIFQLFNAKPRQAKCCPRRYSSILFFFLSGPPPPPHVCMWTDAPCLDVCYFRLSWADKVWVVVGRETAWVPQSNGPACQSLISVMTLFWVQLQYTSDWKLTKARSWVDPVIKQQWRNALPCFQHDKNRAFPAHLPQLSWAGRR